MVPYRKEIKDFTRSCERLLSDALQDQPLSDEELEVLRYYTDELENKFLAEHVR